jgi:hypothetical protein
MLQSDAERKPSRIAKSNGAIEKLAVDFLSAAAAAASGRRAGSVRLTAV